jgi:hypothetical protein
MDATGDTVCVHVAASSAGEAEFQFAHATIIISGESLIIAHAEAPNRILMAFSPGLWKAAWILDPTTQRPLGLSAPAPIATAPTAASPAPPHRSPNPERAAQQQKILDALFQVDYVSLDIFSQHVGEPKSDVERILSTAIGSPQIDSNRLAVAPIQAFLDRQMPTILSEQQPQKLAQILEILKAMPEGQDCDYIQLRLWIKRNPQKKS